VDGFGGDTCSVDLAALVAANKAAVVASNVANAAAATAASQAASQDAGTDYNEIAGIVAGAAAFILLLLLIAILYVLRQNRAHARTPSVKQSTSSPKLQRFEHTDADEVPGVIHGSGKRF
jgi:di/tricarboxylate transporter